jgi:hypothetical protein
VQTQFVQVPGDSLKFVIDIPNAESINHIVVFLTGSEAFPGNLGGQIYFSYPEQNASQPAWHLLGFISNEKPSAIFKVSNLKAAQSQASQTAQLFGQQISVHAQIGISVESMDTIQQSTPAVSADPSKISNFNEFTTKMLQNFYNYITSFGGNENYISMGAARQWYENFQRRLQENPNFWR